MSTQDSEIPWKSFERVVKRIEKFLSPAGAVVTLDDRIKDRATGQARQVDASIRYRVGSVDILITVECRRHADPQDATWIEQLATKRRNIGANGTIAVASAGFYSTAGKIAHTENIYLRTLEELENPRDLSWLAAVNLSVELNTYALRKVGVELYDPELGDELLYDEKIHASGSGKVDIYYPLFLNPKTGRRFDAYEPIRLVEQLGRNWFAGVPIDTEAVHQFTWECHDRGICAQTNKGLKSVRLIHIEFAVKIEKHQMPADMVFKYLDEEKAIVEGAEFGFGKALPGRLLSIYKNGAGGEINISVQAKIDS